MGFYTNLENNLQKLGPIEDIIKNEYFLYSIIAYDGSHYLLDALFRQINQGIKEKRIKGEDLEFFRSGKLIDAIVNLRETTEIYGSRQPHTAERLFKLEHIATIKDLDTLIVSYTHPSIIDALCDKGNFDDRTELTYFVKDGIYKKLPKEVQMTIVSEVLKRGNIEVAQSLLDSSIDSNKIYSTKNNLIR